MQKVIETEFLVTDQYGYWVAAPEFRGWKRIGRSEPIRRGDVAVYPFGSYSATPKEGISLGSYIGKSISQATPDGNIFVYRPDKTQLPGNPYFAQPLPLP